MLELAIVGYGKMGKELEKIAIERGHKIAEIFDIGKPINAIESNFKTALEFTEPSAVINNIIQLAEAGKNIVTGTTGWTDKIEEVRKIIEYNNVGFLWASNFSIGMRLYMKVIESSAELFNKYDDYDVFMHEFHHKNKKDSPSGTAIALAEILIGGIERKKNIFVETCHNLIKQEDLHITSTRGGSIPGTHSVIYDSEADTIEIKHTARNRSGFAIGAIKAAELLGNKKGFYEFGDLLF